MAPRVLAPVDPLLAIPPGDWRALGERLRSLGFDDEHLRRFDDLAPGLHGPPRDALLTWHLRQARGAPWAVALRLFAAGDAVTREDARGLFGEDWLARLRRAGFLEEEPDGALRAAFYMLRVNGFFLVFDELSAGEDAAMGFGSTTIELWRASHPDARVASVLDLGCGAGACAMALSSAADRVVGTDINPRAVSLGKLNAAINGTTHVEFRAGDLFAPVARETFDLIVSQPPFVARPEGAEERTYLFGGARGDELALRLLGAVGEHLTPGGRAIILIEFPEVDGDPIVDRVRSALGERRLRALLVQSEQGVDDACMSFAIAQHPDLGPGYAAAVQSWRTHFERMAVRGQQLTFTVLERVPGDPSDGRRAWIDAQPIRFRDSKRGLSKRRIDAAMRARDLLAAGEEALLAACLRVPDGSRFVEEPDGSTVQHLPDWLLADPAVLSVDAVDLVKRLHDAATVADAVRSAAATQEGATFDEAREVLLPAVRELLGRASLEVA